MSIPESIKKHKPSDFGAVEIRCFCGNKYYVYQITSKWDAEKGRPKKVTGKSIGKITEADGFIPNANGLLIMKENGLVPNAAPVVKNYGAYELLQQLSPHIDSELRKFFPDVFREIRTLALLRLVDGVPTKLVQPAFMSSYMSDLCPDISISEKSVRRFVSLLGTKQPLIDEFMKSSIVPGTSLLFDGTSIFVRSSDSLSARGYNPEHRLNPQSRILYVFDKDSKRPVFYRVLQGSIVDKGAFIDTVKASGCNNCIVIADKGFYSKKNVASLLNAGVRFILPLQDNTVNVEPEFYSNNDDNKFDGVFTYKKRTIWYRKRQSGNKGNWIYTFRDDSRRNEMQASFVEKTERNCGEEEYVPMDVVKQVRFGYFSFCSNIDTTAKNVYLDYKSRWDIEQCFDYLKNSVISSASFAHSDDYFRGWTFLNHISLMYFYGLVNALCNKNLNEKYSPEDVLKLTKNIYKVNTQADNGYQVSAIQKKTQELLDTLNVDLLR